MNTILKLVPVLLFSSLPAWGMTGTEIAQKIYDSNREKDTIQKTEMTLIDKKNSKRVRNFVSFAIDNKRYDSQTLIIFTGPKKIKKTAMLTHNKRSDDSDQWLYLPALKKSRRIASGKKSGRFVGSDFSYEDLEDREVSMDNHKLLKKDKINGKTYYLIETKPKDKSTSIYRRVLSWVNPKTWMVKKAEFYKKKKKPYKTLTVKKFKKVGKSWTATLTEVYNHKLKHKTILKVSSTKFNNKLKKSFFKKSILENTKKIKRFLK